MNIEFKIEKQRILVTGRRIIADSVNFVTFTCEFDEEWNGFTKTAIFTNGDAEQAVLLSDNVDPIEIPSEVLQVGKLYFSVIGLKDDTRLTTKYMDIPLIVYRAGSQGEDIEEINSPQLWEQALATIDEHLNAIPNITIGEVQTIEAGEQATVTITGTAENPALNFYLPKGDKGDTGEQGMQGEKGDKPVYGEDYLTEAEMTKITNDVIKAVFDEYPAAEGRAF